MSNDSRIPKEIIHLTLSEEVRKAILEEVRGMNLRSDQLIDAFPRFYALGFYDGAMEIIKELGIESREAK